jgi:hypothetical protein
VGRESWLLTRLGVPSSIANLAMGTQLAIGLIVAPLGEDAIAGAGIGVMWQNVTAISVFVGIQFGFGALCAQSYGSKNYRRVGVLLQHAAYTSGTVHTHGRAMVLDRGYPAFTWSTSNCQPLRWDLCSNAADCTALSRPVSSSRYVST